MWAWYECNYHNLYITRLYWYWKIIKQKPERVVWVDTRMDARQKSHLSCRENQQNGLCPKWRLRSAWASAQSDQNLRCPHEETLGPYLPIECTVKTDQTGRMFRLMWVFAGSTCHFVGFVMVRLIWEWKKRFKKYYKPIYIHDIHNSDIFWKINHSENLITCTSIKAMKQARETWKLINAKRHSIGKAGKLIAAKRSRFTVTNIKTDILVGSLSEGARTFLAVTSGTSRCFTIVTNGTLVTELSSCIVPTILKERLNK